MQLSPIPGCCTAAMLHDFDLAPSTTVADIQENREYLDRAIFRYAIAYLDIDTWMLKRKGSEQNNMAYIKLIVTKFLITQGVITAITTDKQLVAQRFLQGLGFSRTKEQFTKRRYPDSIDNKLILWWVHGAALSNRLTEINQFSDEQLLATFRVPK